MERLVSVIGPAPSELSKEMLIAKLKKERDRVREALVAFRNNTSFRQKRPTTKKARIDPLAAVAAQAGITPAELRALLEAEKKGELG